MMGRYEIKRGHALSMELGTSHPYKVLCDLGHPLLALMNGKVGPINKLFVDLWWSLKNGLLYIRSRLPALALLCSCSKV